MKERFQDSKIDTLTRKTPSRRRYQQKKRYDSRDTLLQVTNTCKACMETKGKVRIKSYKGHINCGVVQCAPQSLSNQEGPIWRT
jgi:hypothetical protein